VIKRLLPMLLILLLAPVSAGAQDTPLMRDLRALAADYRGYDGAPIVPDLPETLAVGDRASFWIAASAAPARQLFPARAAAD
jgi:hypothetical protein